MLTNAWRSALAARASAPELTALAYLLAPVKDAQSGGHRLAPDWHIADSKPLVRGGASILGPLGAPHTPRLALPTLTQRLRRSRPLSPQGLSHGALTGAILDATGASRAQYSKAFGRTRDAGDAALEVLTGGPITPWLT